MEGFLSCSPCSSLVPLLWHEFEANASFKADFQDSISQLFVIGHTPVKMSTVDASLRYLSPLEGTGLAITVVSIVCGAISLMVVALRAYVRLGERTLGWDDGLMMSGVVRTYYLQPS